MFLYTKNNNGLYNLTQWIWITREGSVEEGEAVKERNLNGRGRKGAVKGEKGMERERNGKRERVGMVKEEKGNKG